MNRSSPVYSPNIAAGSGTALGEQFRAIAEIGGDVAWIVDCASGTPTYISPSVENLLGYGLADFRDQLGGAQPDGPLADLCAGLPARLKRFADGDRSRLRVVRQFDQRGRDGRVVPLEVISTLIEDDCGAAAALVGVLRDVRVARARADEQRRFASMLNHEFRTPLSTIDGAIQRLESGSAGAPEPTRQRYRKIAGAVDRLIGMLDDYLSPERLEAIGATRRPDTLDPAALLEEGAHQAREAGRAVSVELGELPGALRCDPQGLRLALKVLVDNALLYSAPDSAIGLAARRADGGIELLVRDCGPGVPASEAAQIFDKFYRGHNAAALPGSGLGLYMARSVVEVHGGSLGVRNRGEGGAEFRIWLPTRGGSGKNVASDRYRSDNPLVNQ